MNYIERFLTNNPFSQAMHRYLDLPLLLSWAKLPKKTSVLELGCGTGESSRYLEHILKPKNYIGTDNDKEMIRLAENKNSSGSRVVFQLVDFSRLPFTDKSFDAVFNMSILHTLANWKKAVKEIHRVLKPGGKLILRDLSIETFTYPVLGLLLRQVLENPYEHMFDQKEFLSYLRRVGFSVTHESDSNWSLFLVAEKNS